MICNPKTDSKSVLGGPDTTEDRERSAGGTSKANGQACWPRVPHGQHGPLPTCATRGPHVELTWHALVGRSIFSLLLPFKYLHSLQFSQREEKLEIGECL
jgi:hypothetical protein